MIPSQLQQITFTFPNGSDEETAFWSTFAHLLGSIPQAEVHHDHIVFAPTQPIGALPRTRFQHADVPIPQLVFSPPLPLERTFGGLSIGDSHALDRVLSPIAHIPAYLSIHDLAERISGHLTRLDHTGVNLTPALLPRADWDVLMHHCARSAALFRYPGEEWPFILPATEGEVVGDIDRFVLGREPKFEFVYANGPDQPILQWSIDTDLTRAELEALFPAPEGEVLFGLENIFRTVYVTHPWPGVILRFDLTYRNDAGVTDWATGEWIAREGERMRA